MRIDFPYPDIFLDVPDENLSGIYNLPEYEPSQTEEEILRRSIENPIGSVRLREMAKGKKSVLIVCDDVSRPTPAWKVIPFVLEELKAAGIEDAKIEFMMALGTHRTMTDDEMRVKVGDDVFAHYPVYNHEWDNPEAQEYMGKTDQGVEVWINKKVAQADLVIGIGRIMPIDICGFTGGGKILIPGCCGEATNSEMHWKRVDIDNKEILGKRDNPVRSSIDELARKSGLDFIVNIIMDSKKNVLDCVSGDLVEAHREGCRRIRKFHEVRISEKADIVVIDGWPFDIEFWQVNKALHTGGEVVKNGGAVICVSPCYEGLSPTHEDVLLKYGYQPVAKIKQLVESGEIHPKVIGVHMIQVSDVAVEKAKVFLVTGGISEEDVKKVGLRYAKTPQQALDMAFADLGPKAKVVVLRQAAEMLPVIEKEV